jgi:excisionase family DNA binding protein
MTDTATPVLLSKSETARFLGVSRPTVDKAIRREQLATVTLGDAVYVPRAWLDRWLSSASARNT